LPLQPELEVEEGNAGGLLAGEQLLLEGEQLFMKGVEGEQLLKGAE